MKKIFIFMICFGLIILSLTTKKTNAFNNDINDNSFNYLYQFSYSDIDNLNYDFYNYIDYNDKVTFRLNLPENSYIVSYDYGKEQATYIDMIINHEYYTLGGRAHHSLSIDLYGVDMLLMSYNQIATNDEYNYNDFFAYDDDTESINHIEIESNIDLSLLNNRYDSNNHIVINYLTMLNIFTDMYKIANFYYNNGGLPDSAIINNAYFEGVSGVLNNLEEYELYTREQYEDIIQMKESEKIIYGEEQFQLGRAQGLSEAPESATNNIWDFINQLFVHLSGLFNIDIIPGVKIGYIVGIVILFGLIKFILWVVN